MRDNQNQANFITLCWEYPVTLLLKEFCIFNGP